MNSRHTSMNAEEGKINQMSPLTDQREINEAYVSSIYFLKNIKHAFLNFVEI